MARKVRFDDARLEAHETRRAKRREFLADPGFARRMNPQDENARPNVRAALDWDDIQVSARGCNLAHSC